MNGKLELWLGWVVTNANVCGIKHLIQEIQYPRGNYNAQHVMALPVAWLHGFFPGGHF